MTENIGCAFYEKGSEPGTLTARWCHTRSSPDVISTGIARGGPTSGYGGTYEIRYFDVDGKEVAVLDLEVRKTGECYTLTWSKDGHVSDRGLGMEIPGGLVAGWKKMPQ